MRLGMRMGMGMRARIGGIEGRRWNSRVEGIVDQISALTLLETADLVASLKTRLNITEAVVASPAAAAAPVEPVETVAAPKEEEKTIFTIKLDAYETGSKAKVIKEVKALLGLNLVEAKKFVEAAPKILREAVPKEEADKMKETLTALGCKISLE